jgi:hypothetical protein
MSENVGSARAVAVSAGLALAVVGAAIVVGFDDWWVRLLSSPPLLMGLGAAGLAAARGPRQRQAARLVVEGTFGVAASAYGVVGILLILPALVIGMAVALFFAFVAAGPGEERPARTVLATGALWVVIFGLIARVGAPPIVHVGLVASLALALASLAWLRELRRARCIDLRPARAIALS